MKSNKGITLIALVITIIVLLILAGVSISMVVGENGILNRATDASTKTNDAKDEEEKQFAMAEAAMNFENTKYKNVPIPAGFAPTRIDGEDEIEDGLVIVDNNGNEFVWIPVNSEDEYVRNRTFLSSSDSNSNSLEATDDTGYLPDDITSEIDAVMNVHRFLCI